MKHISILLALAMVAAGSVPAQTLPPASTFHTITYSWGAPAASVNCSATVTTSCVSGYTLTVTPPAGVTGNNVFNTTALTQDFTPGGFLYCGTWNGSVIANWKSDTGASVPSAAISTTTQVACPFKANPATGPVTSVVK